MKNCVVRVATNNNFNCTEREFRQLDRFAAQNPDKIFFVNSNARTPKLRAILDHPYKTVITLNPDLNVVPYVADRGLAVHSSVSFYRVKWIPERPEIKTLIDKALNLAPVVITMQRFNSRACMERYADPKDYRLVCVRFRLHGEALKKLEDLVDHETARGRRLHICDRKGIGCLGCGLCVTLNGAAPGTPIKSLNLSTSGVCPYNCPDCYAKAVSKRCVHGNPIAYDQIIANRKQRGKTKHIQENLKCEAA